MTVVPVRARWTKSVIESLRKNGATGGQDRRLAIADGDVHSAPLTATLAPLLLGCQRLRGCATFSLTRDAPQANVSSAPLPSNGS